MNPPVDTSTFQLQGEPDPEEDAKLAVREGGARNYVASFSWAKPVQETLLAFGVSRILALFLVRFVEPIRWAGEEDKELWVVVGDLPPAYFGTDASPEFTVIIESATAPFGRSLRSGPSKEIRSRPPPR